MVTTFVPELVDPAQARLGEGPIWDAASERLYWIDILDRRLFVADGAGRRLESRQLDSMPGTVMPTAGGLLVADEAGLALHHDTGTETRLNDELAAQPDRRFNDGKTDARGRAFVGTLTLSGDGVDNALYRIEPGGRLTAVIDGVGLSNGLGWSPDGTAFYFVDTPTGKIDAFEYDIASGSLGRRRTFAVIPEGRGMPDGLCVDDDGGVWVALFGGSAVLRYDSEGWLDACVEFDIPNITSCAFGGPDRSTLFITTAAVDLDEEFLAAHPHAGGLFTARVGRSGPSAVPWVA
jgi:sugar lactone lactonase YvrE